MKEHYVTYEQSQILKRLGFKEETTHYYVNFKSDGEVKLWSCNPPENHNARLSINEVCSAPRLDQAQKWLREGKGIMIEPFASIPDKMWAYRLYHTKGEKFGMTLVIPNKSIVVYEFNSYELALSAGIDKALELLTDKLTDK